MLRMNLFSVVQSLNIFLQIIFFLNFISVYQVFAEVQTAEERTRFVLLRDVYDGLGLQALQLRTSPARDQNLNATFYTPKHFKPGTKFVFLNKGSLLSYGHAIDGEQVGDLTLLPMIFLHPLNEDGSVNTNLKLAMPAHFFNYESDGSPVINDKRIKQFFSLCESSQMKDCQNNNLQPNTYSLEVFNKNNKKLAENLMFARRLLSAQDEELRNGSSNTAADSASGHEDKDLNSQAGITNPASNLSHNTNTTNTNDSATNRTAINLDPNPSTTQKYYEDPALTNALKLHIINKILSPRIKVNGENKHSFKKSETPLNALSQFILVPGETQKVGIKNSEQCKQSAEVPENCKIYLRLVYQITNDGKIALNSNGESIQYYIPEKDLFFTDLKSRQVKPLSGNRNSSLALQSPSQNNFERESENGSQNESESYNDLSLTGGATN